MARALFSLTSFFLAIILFIFILYVVLIRFKNYGWREREQLVAAATITTPKKNHAISSNNSERKSNNNGGWVIFDAYSSIANARYIMHVRASMTLCTSVVHLQCIYTHKVFFLPIYCRHTIVIYRHCMHHRSISSIPIDRYR